MTDPFGHNEYVFYKYAGAARVFDGNGNSILYAEREGGNKLGKPIHVYTSKYRTKELLTITSPRGLKELVYVLGDGIGLPWSIIPLSLEFRVTDATTGKVVGSAVQRSRRRITKDEWFLTSGGITVGKLTSIRYFTHSLIWPRKYRIVAQDERVVGTFEQHRDTLRDILNFKYTMKITDRCIDTRLLVAAGVVITALTISF